MYVNITPHNAKKSQSSSNIFQYLDKENQEQKLKNEYLILEGKEEEINPNSVEHFFNQDYNPYDLNDKNAMVNIYEASEQIDKNRGTQNLSSSNFYMLNISPSEKELQHMEKIAEEELESRGLKYEECKGNEVALEFFEEQKDQLMKLQIKLYTKDLMNEYAKHMDREIYANQEALPSNAERKEMQPEIDKRYNEFLEEQGLREKIGKDYILVHYDKKVDTEIGNIYNFQYQGKEEEIFATQDKVKEISGNLLAIEKSYFENKLQEQNDKEAGIYNDEKIKLKVQIDKETAHSTMITIKPDEYGQEVKMWLNNRDFNKLEGGEIEMNKYKADKLINSAIERDKEQKTLVEIKFTNFTAREIKAKEGKEADTMITFNQEVKGLKEPIKITFKESELKQKGDKYFVEKYTLDYRTEKAKELGIISEFGDKKEEIKNQVWKEQGFDTTKRKVEGKDLLYFAKVERERTYKHTDKAVLKNRPILKKIEEYSKGTNPLHKAKIEALKQKLLRDKHTGEVIKEGVKKGGMQYHTHIVVSRHDRTSVNRRDKVSMSPNANQKGGQLNNGAKVGFNRDEFFQKAEKMFDVKFEYNRPENEKYAVINKESKSYKSVTSRAKGELVGQIKAGIDKQTGMDIVKGELNAVQKAKKEIMPLPIPTSLPKNKIDLIIKVVKLIKNISMDKGIQY